MMEYLAKFLILSILFFIAFLIYRSLVLRSRILLHLKENHKSIYEEIKLNYTIKDILIGSPEVIKNQFRQNRRLLSKDICYDKRIRSLQREYRTAIILTLVTTVCYVVLLLFGLRLLLSTWTWYS